MSLDGISLGHSYSTQNIAVGKNGVFMYFPRTEIIARVISDLHNMLWKLVAVLPSVL